MRHLGAWALNHGPVQKAGDDAEELALDQGWQRVEDCRRHVRIHGNLKKGPIARRRQVLLPNSP
jgi:hypothetical protein